MMGEPKNSNDIKAHEVGEEGFFESKQLRKQWPTWQCLKGKNDNQECDRKSKDIIAKRNDPRKPRVMIVCFLHALPLPVMYVLSTRSKMLSFSPFGKEEMKQSVQGG